MKNKTYTEEELMKAIDKAHEFKGGFDKIGDPMIVTDEDGVILFANDAVLQRKRFSIDEIIGKTPGVLWGNQKDEGFYEYMWETIKVEKKPFSSTMTNRRKDGTYYSCDLKIYPILNDNKNIDFFVGIETNYTDSV